MPEPAISPFRAGLLEGATVTVAPGDNVIARATADLARALGAQVAAINAADLLDETATVRAMEGVVRRAPNGLGTVVVDAAALFDGAGVRGALDGAWIVTRAAASTAMIDAAAGGRIVLVAPRPDAGEHVEPARAGLENMARTLGVEWARYDIRTTMLAPSAGTDPVDIARLVAYLASPGGDYFTGARFDLA